MFNVFEKLHELVLAGGSVMPPLLLGCAVLWFALSNRMQALKRGSVKSLHELYTMEPKALDDELKTGDSVFLTFVRDLKKSHHYHSDVLMAQAYETFSKGNTLITTVVMISPLLGLLGTVSGMIETFESLGDMTLFSQTGGIAGGISQALISTQMGLAVAIPGLILGRLLGRKQNALLVELEQLCELKKLEQKDGLYA